MADQESVQDRLLAAARRTLLPHPFPPRRDVEFAAHVPVSGNASTFFYDHLWPRPGRLALVAARVGGGDMQSALRAAGLRHLLRAALMTVEDPVRAIGLCRDAAGAQPFDVAISILDTASGEIASATHGVATSAPAGAQNGGQDGGNFRRDRLAAGSLFWLAAGVSTLPLTGAADAEPQTIVDDAGTSIGDAALALVSYKLPTRAAKCETLNLFNDLADIPRVIVAFEEFCARQGIADSAVPGVNVALDEVLTNVVSYAFEDGAAHEIYVDLQAIDLQADGQRLVIDIKDDGRPFDPLRAAAPELSAEIDDRPIGGLGIHFVRSILDDVRYRRSDGWNILTLEKNARPEPTP